MNPRAALAVSKDTLELWTSRRAFQHAGALAFFTLFSMAPLLIILIAVAGAVLGERAVRGEITEQISEYIGPQAADAVSDAIEQSSTRRSGLLPAILGIAALVLGATTVFGQMQASLNQFWGVRAKPSQSGLRVFLRTRLVSLGLVMILGFLLLVSFALTVAVGAVIRYAQEWVPIPPVAVAAINLGLSLFIATLLFAVIYKVLPDVRLEWRDMWRGALVTGVLFVTGQFLISWYLTRAAPASTYGAAGSLVLVLLWVYYSALILFLGAAFTRAYIRQRGDHIDPKPTAVKVRTEVLEEDAQGHQTHVAAQD
ncbi:MAG TPA: YihY/virulence factor BrkB family protein [Gemmatimonadaceae bacterium]|nr:YihY/virulence factor BrkB family protein [Gemmatimonadaceae bacterium]